MIVFLTAIWLFTAVSLLTLAVAWIAELMESKV